MSVNKNNPGIDQSTYAEPFGANASQAGAWPGAQTIVLDDMSPTPPQRSPVAEDLKVLRALQSILGKRQADAWIDEMKAQIATELEWSEA